jgi:hypothetical protein
MSQASTRSGSRATALIPSQVRKAWWLHDRVRYSAATAGNAAKAVASGRLQLAVVEDRLVVAIAHDVGCPVVEEDAPLERCSCELLGFVTVPRGADLR